MSEIATIDRIIQSKGDGYRFVYSEYDGKFEPAVDAVRVHVKKNRLHEEYDFWTDGCNYADEDYIVFRKKHPDNSKCGSCWRSRIWTFEDNVAESTARQ